MLVKEEVREAVRSMPDEFSIDDLVEELIVLYKIETGLQQVAKGKTLPMKEAKEKLQKWLR